MLGHTLDSIRISIRWVALGFGLLVLGLPPAVRAEETEAKTSPRQEEQAAEAPAAPRAQTSRRIGPRTPTRSPYLAAATRRQQPAEAPLVIGNDDLEAMYGPAEEQLPSPAAGDALATEPKGEATDGGPLQALRDEQAGAAEDRQRTAGAQETVAAVRQEVARLEKQLLAIKNPFAARPELNDEEKEKRAKTTEPATARLARTEKQLAEARQRLAEAEGELADARTSRR